MIVAHDGLEALDKLASNDVSLIICDWMMPRMDGAELCRRVRNDASTSHIPFVMLTAKTDTDSKVEGMNVGADAYIEIQIVRLKKAAQLLAEGNMKVSEVCYTVGFSNPSYFSKCFYKQFGVSPSEIRK